MKTWLPAIMLTFSVVSLGHPVSFEGGYGLMFYQQPDMADWQATYTFRPSLALGIDYSWDKMGGEDRQFLVPRLNWLLTRWNGKEYQANIYVSAGLGAGKRGETAAPAALGSLEADYETRAVYLSAKAAGIVSRHVGDLVTYQARAGLAPYLGEFEGLNTWIILQAQYFPEADMEKLRVAPVLRFFYKNVLWEAGVSARGTWLFNFMAHL